MYVCVYAKSHFASKLPVYLVLVTDFGRGLFYVQTEINKSSSIFQIKFALPATLPAM